MTPALVLGEQGVCRNAKTSTSSHGFTAEDAVHGRVQALKALVLQLMAVVDRPTEWSRRFAEIYGLAAVVGQVADTVLHVTGF
jgi:hypothetical protein